MTMGFMIVRIGQQNLIFIKAARLSYLHGYVVVVSFERCAPASVLVGVVPAFRRPGKMGNQVPWDSKCSRGLGELAPVSSDIFVPPFFAAGA